MSNINQLSSAIKFALFVGATATLATASAFAQGAPEEAKELDSVIVVGSKIKRQVEEEGAQPVQVLTRADIERTGLNNVYEILNTITSSDGSGLSTVTTQTNGSDGSQQVSLRGLGSGRTLVLVDGKRWVTDIDGTVDFSTIPVAIIQRIEVLKDGASAIYGSDAIAGVINIVTRRDYDGAQAGLYYGQTTKGDGARKGADITIGAKGERSNTIFSLSHTSQESIFAGDRALSDTPTFQCDEIYGFGACSSGSGLFGNFSSNPGLGVVSQSLNIGANLADGIQTTDFSTFNNARRYNFAPINYLQQPAKRTNVFAAGSFDITDNLSAFVRASYTKRTSDQQLAPVPLTIANSGANGAAWQFPVSANSIFNPFGVDLTTASYRMEIAGPRHNFFDYDIFGLQAGLEGNFSIGERAFNWELTGQRNDGQYDQRGENYINLVNLRNAVGPSFATAAGIFCGTFGVNVVTNCTPFGITAGPTAGVGARIPISGAPGTFYTVTQADVDAAIDYVSYTLVDQTGITSTNYSGNLSGELFELPGGMFGFAFGFETRKDEIFYQPDALVAGFGSSNNFSAPTRGFTEVDELYLEVVAPILKDVTGFQELELSAAVRKSDYKAGGLVDGAFINTDPGSPTNAKFGLKWKPIDDLLVRFNWGETFRAPSANDLYSGQAEGFPAARDPCRSNASNTGSVSPFFTDLNVYNRCVADGVDPGLGFNGTVGGPGFGLRTGGGLQPNAQIRAQAGGNPFLTPEFGTNRTAGIVYSPSWLEGFNISLDWWNIKLQDALAARSSQFVLNACYTGTDTSFCSFIERNAQGDLALVRTTSFNLNTLEVTGADLGVGYNFSTGFGDFRTKLDVTYVHENLANGVDSVGNYDGTPNWEYRAQLDLGWTKGDWSASWTTRYTSDLTEVCFTVCNEHDGDGLNHTGQYAVHDVQLGWKAPWDARIAIGARNVFGKEPPILTNNTFAHSFDAAYDIPGGAFWYAQYRQDF